MTESASRWQERFRAEQVVWAQVADGRRERGLAAINRAGPVQLHAWDVSNGTLRQLTDRPGGTLLGFLGGDGRHAYYLDDRDGGEVGHFVRVPWEGGPIEDVTPNLPSYSSFGGAVSRDGTRLGITLADAAGYALVAVDLAEDGSIDAPRVLHRAAALLWPPSLSSDGKLAVMGSNERTGSRHCALVAFDGDTGEQIAELWDGPGSDLWAGPFAPAGAVWGGRAGHWLAGTSDRPGFRKPLLWNPHTGERQDLPVDAIAGDVEPLDWSSDGSHLLLRQTHRASERLWIYDVASHTARRLGHAEGTYGGFVHSGIAFGPNGEVVTPWQDAANPPQVIALDPATGARERILLPAGPVPPGQPLRSVTFASSDGQEVQAWLAVPTGPGPFPAVLHTHGGPEAAMPDAYFPEAQAWLDHGYAFLSVNYRGSTTFGREFQQQIWGDPGRWELEDVVAARAWLVAEGIAREDQIFKTGASYGGYLTLLALGRRPDLWAGGMAAVPVADWRLLYEDSSDAMRAYAVAFLGGTPDEVPETYAAASPITDAAAVQAPLLILQQRHDARTPARQVERYVERLRALGKDIELVWFETGHLGPAADPEQGVAEMERKLAFAARALGR